MKYYSNLKDFLENKDKDGVLASEPNFLFNRFHQHLIYAGSWNPLTYGHLEIAHYAKKAFNKNIFYFELSIDNVDKLDCTKYLNVEDMDLKSRINQFDKICETIIITRASTFVQKSFLFPNSIFVVGTDTLSRINNNKYYFNSNLQKLECINKIKRKRCRFLVFPRYPNLDSRKVYICDKLKELCLFIEEFNLDYIPNDISSTKIRESATTC